MFARIAWTYPNLVTMATETQLHFVRQQLLHDVRWYGIPTPTTYVSMKSSDIIVKCLDSLKPQISLLQQHEEFTPPEFPEKVATVKLIRLFGI